MTVMPYHIFAHDFRRYVRDRQITESHGHTKKCVEKGNHHFNKTIRI